MYITVFTLFVSMLSLTPHGFPEMSLSRANLPRIPLRSATNDYCLLGPPAG